METGLVENVFVLAGAGELLRTWLLSSRLLDVCRGKTASFCGIRNNYV